MGGSFNDEISDFLMGGGKKDSTFLLIGGIVLLMLVFPR